MNHRYKFTTNKVDPICIKPNPLDNKTRIMKQLAWYIENRQCNTPAFEFFCKNNGGKDKLREIYRLWLKEKK